MKEAPKEKKPMDANENMHANLGKSMMATTASAFLKALVAGPEYLVKNAKWAKRLKKKEFLAYNERNDWAHDGGGAAIAVGAAVGIFTGFATMDFEKAYVVAQAGTALGFTGYLAVTAAKVMAQKAYVKVSEAGLHVGNMTLSRMEKALGVTQGSMLHGKASKTIDAFTDEKFGLSITKASIESKKALSANTSTLDTNIIVQKGLSTS